MAEGKITRALMLLFTKFGRLFRNNVGLFETKDGRKVRTGLCVGSSDTIGWTELVVTPEMVGKKVAVFTSIEIKTKGTRTTALQRNWLQAVNTAGGIAMIEKDPMNVINNILAIKRECAQPDVKKELKQ